MKLALVFLFSFGALSQQPIAPAPKPTPHDLLLKAKRMGLDPKTIDQVEPILEQAAAGWSDTDPRSPEYAQTLMLLGVIKQYTADLDINAIRLNVEPLYKRALAVYNRSVIPPDPLDLALTMELEAAALNAIGQVEDAQPLADRAFAIRKEHIREMQKGSKAVGAAFRPGEGITAPVAISRQEPAYADIPRFLKIQGTVTFQAVVDEHGAPQDMSLVHSLGYGLDENALEAVRNWRFRPGTSGGQAVPVIVSLDVNFRAA
jgi:TonB family protein